MDQLKRLIEYSGSKLIDTHKTADGAIATVEFNGEPHKLFVVPVIKPDVIKEEPIFDY